MSDWVVSDSGILISTVLNETFSAQASELWKHWLQQPLYIAAPVLFKYEIVATIRKHVSRGTLTEQRGLEVRDHLFAHSVVLLYSDALLRRSYELATQFNRPTACDSQYLAVAEMLDCEFWTQDERLYNTVKDTLSWVKWLGNFRQS